MWSCKQVVKPGGALTAAQGWAEQRGISAPLAAAKKRVSDCASVTLGETFSAEARAPNAAVFFGKERSDQAQFGKGVPVFLVKPITRMRRCTAINKCVFVLQVAPDHACQHLQFFCVGNSSLASQSQDHLADDVFLNFTRLTEDRQLAVVEIDPCGLACAQRLQPFLDSATKAMPVRSWVCRYLA